ncbi:hypothetical protein A3SI_04512 [Nitritalea halalkaliphila LW7]|uniref:Uncharacterized protein n=2 Tax=Nitritalea TaxID=1187887 RepID=I5C8A5_9BACT|nr:hypothetical protein A3SI_04512 [Nitritalea halalkaliphila LW7]
MAVSCSFEDPLLPDDCLQARQTEMVRIDDVRFGPLRADSWLTPADTVSAQDLFLNLAFGFALDAQEEEETLLPARAGFWPADFFRLLDSSSSGAMGYLVQDQRVWTAVLFFR